MPCLSSLNPTCCCAYFVSWYSLVLWLAGVFCFHVPPLPQEDWLLAVEQSAAELNAANADSNPFRHGNLSRASILSVQTSTAGLSPSRPARSRSTSPQRSQAGRASTSSLGIAAARNGACSPRSPCPSTNPPPPPSSPSLRSRPSHTPGPPAPRSVSKENVRPKTQHPQYVLQRCSLDASCAVGCVCRGL